jgi:transcriptional regulator with XRE-family HTH domain
MAVLTRAGDNFSAQMVTTIAPNGAMKCRPPEALDDNYLAQSHPSRPQSHRCQQSLEGDIYRWKSHQPNGWRGTLLLAFRLQKLAEWVQHRDMASLNVGNLGAYLREQRRSAQLSLRQLADAAGVSNPYLSQIERGLRKPSADILQQLAKALRISAETLYVQAGILDERERDELETRAVILADPSITERQKQVLLQIYESFRKENGLDNGLDTDAPRTVADAVQDAEHDQNR